MSKSNLSRLSAAFANTIKPKPQRLQPTIHTSVATNPDQPEKPKRLHKEINGLLRENDPHMLLEKFKNLSQDGHFRKMGRDIYKLTIHRFSLAGQHSLIEQALETQKEYISEEGFAMRIIYLYGKYGTFELARKVFDELPDRNVKQGVKCFNALLGAAVNSGNFEKAYELFRELPAKLSIEPNVETYNVAMNALCKMGRVDEAVSLFDEMEANGMKPSVISFNTLLCVYYEEAEFEEGEELWERMIKSEVVPNINSYNSKLRALVNHGRLVEAIEIAMQLESKGLKPTADTFNALINGFVKDGDLSGAKRWYNELIKSGCVPNKTTFSTLASFLCENGDYGSAFKLGKKMFEGYRHISVDEAVLQNVVDELAKKLMLEEAKTLVKLGQSSSYFTHHLVMPNNTV